MRKLEKRTIMTSNQVRGKMIGKGRLVVRRIGLTIFCVLSLTLLLSSTVLALEEDPSELFWAMIEEARWGEPEAQYAVAMMYAAGEGVEVDQDEAADWFEKAAEEGHPYAMFKIAERYETGIGVTRDSEKAITWYRKAAETGDGKADDKAYYEQVRQAEFASMKERYRQEQQEEDRKYQDQVRKENQRHQERMNKQKYSNYNYNRHDYNHYDYD
jgi:TPR repeat protein